VWYVYIVECSDTTLYTGVTTDIERRVMEHNSSKKGAKYTRNKRPVVLMTYFEFNDRSSACKEEYRIKQLTRLDKIKLIKNNGRI
jgi:putative endonuclease